MFDEQWAAIVYGRSYHLDFRIIAVPEDFTKRDIDWAMPYILATTRRANKLITHPRWSLFKNESHCVVGVTCMVRDLICQLGADLIDMLCQRQSPSPTLCVCRVCYQTEHFGLSVKLASLYW